MTENVLAIRSLEVAPVGGQRRAPILKGVNLEIAKGEILCLVGESGSGKTVTALSMMGLLPPRELAVTGGSVRLDGEELIGASARRLRMLRATHMAMIFQEPLAALNPVMTVGRQIEEVLSAHTYLTAAECRDHVLTMFEQVNLPDAERIRASYPHQLSGGQRQRAMIAMAMIMRPQLLIADEPTSALDVKTQRQILDLIRALRKRNGTAILFITHDMGVVSEIADRVSVIRGGEVVETGPRDEILTRPRQTHTRTLLSAVPSLIPRAARADASGDVVLTVRALAKTYMNPSWFRQTHEVNALAGVDLTLTKGRTLGIVGESGSGKSTLARCVLRLIEPSHGAIHLGETNITNLSSGALKMHRRDIQIVFQDPYRSLNPRCSIGESIIEGPTNFGMPRHEALAEATALLELVGMPDGVLDLYPHQFSGGQRQRIALARALALKPQVLVADEPVSALDMTTQATVLRLLADVQDKLGIAILFITHDLRVAAQVCDDVAIMRNGRIVEHGATARVLTDPQHAYTRLLCEAAPGRRWDFANFRPAPSVSAFDQLIRSIYRSNEIDAA